MNRYNYVKHLSVDDNEKLSTKKILTF